MIFFYLCVNVAFVLIHGCNIFTARRREYDLSTYLRCVIRNELVYCKQFEIITVIDVTNIDLKTTSAFKGSFAILITNNISKTV